MTRLTHIRQLELFYKVHQLYLWPGALRPEAYPLVACPQLERT
ncbi:hypothetical protein FB556_0462 [Enteractinococcus coprophilus]|uniref:Uncharacterized protein n=1 Tax=Enteractinococcus coprophilus TaxID=1027633 RepID=A0A543AN55_9MICC|nr:hypothetical protein FB556_0462 [Enteractinococcus coprophilus]